jgi:hypothetical protein
MTQTVEIPFPSTTAKDTPALGGIGRMVNVIMEQLPNGQINRKRAPGLTQFTTSASGAVHCRGLLTLNTTQMFAVYNDYAELVTSNGTSTSLGPVSGSDMVTMAKNIANPPNSVCVTSGGVYLLTPNAAPVPYPDPNIGAPNSVCFGDGYFFFTYANGLCRSSAINGTAINPLDVIEVNSSSTPLLRGVFHAQTLYLFTQSTIEAWTDTANPVAFPFSRSAVIPRGLLGAQAVAGFESGFTATLIFVGRDHIVYLLQGYSPVRISTSDIERRIQAVKDESTLHASVYESEGHAIWQLTSPDFTLTYDITNSCWTERASYQQTYSSISCGAFAFDKWLVGDDDTGKIGKIDSNSYMEYDQPLIWSIDSLETRTFPRQMIVARGDFNFVMGTGLIPPDDAYNPVTQYASFPQVSISWSDDGGATYSFPVLRGLGAIGITGNAVTVLRTGQTFRQGRVWRLEVSDPVYCGLLGGTMDVI